MSYKEAMKYFTKAEKKARVVCLYYEDQGWLPCVPILEKTKARVVPHPSCPTFNVVRVVEA